MAPPDAMSARATHSRWFGGSTLACLARAAGLPPPLRGRDGGLAAKRGDRSGRAQDRQPCAPVRHSVRNRRSRACSSCGLVPGWGDISPFASHGPAGSLAVPAPPSGQSPTLCPVPSRALLEVAASNQPRKTFRAYSAQGKVVSRPMPETGKVLSRSGIGATAACQKGRGAHARPVPDRMHECSGRDQVRITSCRCSSR